MESLLFPSPHDIHIMIVIDAYIFISCLSSFFAARVVQTRRGDTGPLSPDHLREAYRAYQEETGHVGAARPIRAKKLFVR